ncbi:septum formation inhibitor Maf [Thermoleptolyngbya oregonensis NK1-22]|uniref:Nucleoside triphosphate pyrophosphatase n=1 Tax=Thermoleptolyngbya oregonensis NK1-22 TaxID=2547457 RepID=A0AA96Y410_9CYAN|nr:nucleoside triphosphate pyrophosphatase [Thermoleptolyngbya oregonensis]WOB42771.1 septum formation inhibitor Maf [Thermoleptolyngbya oregonensis NK1-22]
MLPSFVLASASPARRRLLQLAGIEPIVYPSAFDESQVREPNASVLVQKLAEGKARAVAPKFPDALVLGCDSVLALNGEIYGKPAHAEEAIARWKQMRGRVGELYTGHALIDGAQGKMLVRCGMTQVQFANVSDRQIEAYVATGEPMNCAGCFALEGRGGLFVEQLMGCHSNVIGLSLPLLRQMIAELGYDVTGYWSGG